MRMWVASVDFVCIVDCSVWGVSRCRLHNDDLVVLDLCRYAGKQDIRSDSWLHNPCLRAAGDIPCGEIDNTRLWATIAHGVVEAQYISLKYLLCFWPLGLFLWPFGWPPDINDHVCSGFRTQVLCCMTVVIVDTPYGTLRQV